MLFYNKQKNGIFFHATKFLLIFSLALCSFCACNNNGNGKKDLEANPQQGTLRLFVDESFQPIISQQIMVFESSFPQAHIIVKYEPEADCFRDFEKDSSNMIIVARGLNEPESEYYNSKLGHRPRFSVIAFDAVSMIVNAQASDSVFSLKELNKLLTSNEKQPYQVILDGENATSTIRYLLDSITYGKSFGSNVSGVKGSKQVIDLV
ncbi:substrate-binding domain-containing protein, partial [Arachidicoccus sp.]|uniref:substrate-binding domain-containing protein n=1 Tax=Arachidicoccus sp. TaxID=1872624 RepID=UPI003D2119E6